MNIIDISWPIAADMTQYKDRERLKLDPLINDYMLEHTLCLHTHIGTHIDAPLHVDPLGTSIDQLPLNLFLGPCQVIDLSHLNDSIKKIDIDSIPITPGNRILFKTRNSQQPYNAPFNYSFIGVAYDAAQWLIEQGIILIGIDYLGIERNQPTHPTHKAFAHANIPILEGLRLTDVEAGSYFLSALPLKFINLDAALTRAILITEW